MLKDSFKNYIMKWKTFLTNNNKIKHKKYPFMTKYVTNEYFLTKMINKSNMHLFNQDILGIMTLDKDKDI